MSSLTFRRFTEELNSFVGKTVAATTGDGKEYSGTLVGVDENMSIILDRVSGAGENVFKVAINGSNVREIKLTTKPYDLKALGERLNRYFPGLVQVREDIGVIIVMDKIKVTEKGVEGTGLAADKAKTIFDEYVRDTKK
ncbi:MAG: Lsm family RNA-binding protein [Nitrososphaerota archaeon]|nr:Lsm family RNA-binding protein [Nitrososphaerota archaeon]